MPVQIANSAPSMRTVGHTRLAVPSLLVDFKTRFLCAVATSVAIFLTSGVVAQESVSDQLKRLRRDLEDIQAYVYRSPNAAPVAGSTTRVAPDSDAMAILQRQVQEMQSQMRDLTGQIEKVRYDILGVSDRLDKLVGDVDLRLQALERGNSGQQQAPGQGAALSQSQDTPAPTVQTRQDGETTIISSGSGSAANQLQPGVNSLGTISASDAAAPRGPGSAPSENTQSASRPAGNVVLPDGPIQDQYNYAFGLLQQRDYVAAEASLREFVKRHPNDPLTGNAMYWMGETFYVRKDYPEAARVFLDAYQRFPKGNKAADNLFKLGRSLAEIGETKSSCATYSELLKSFPDANERILANARGDMKRLNCT
jgi:tol-pal system protein YbgF